MARHFLGGRSRNTKDSLELCVELCSRSGIWRKILCMYLRYSVYLIPVFLYVYVRPCEAHVLRLSFFLEEDRETQKIPLNYALNYAPGAASDGEFHGKYLRYSVYLTSMFFVCVRTSLWSPCFTAQHFLGERSRNTKDFHELGVELCFRSGIWWKISR